MVRISIIWVLSSFFLVTSGWSQQLPLFTQYREYQTILNPASVSSDYLVANQGLNFGLSYRAQWTGISGNPHTQVLQGSYFWDDYRGVNMLAGGYLINDQTGPSGMTGLYGRVAGVISDDPAYGGFSLGLNFGVVQYRIKASEIRLRDGGDVVGDQNLSKFFPDVGFGLFFYKSVRSRSYQDNIVYGGVSVPQLLAIDLEFQSAEGTFGLDRVPHFYAQAGFIAFLEEDSFLEPSLWVRYVPNIPVSADVNFRYQLPMALWLGAGGSTRKSIHLEAGVWLGDRLGYDHSVRIGYSYDHYFSSISPVVGGTHELNLSVSFDR